MNSRKLSLTILATLCACTSFLALGSASAFALVRHEYLSQITGLSYPRGLAVDSNSDVYVADNGYAEDNPVVDRFGASGAPLPFSASKPYVEGAKLLGTPTGPGGTLVPFVQFGDPYPKPSTSLTIDDTNGDLYVANGTVVDVFSETGEYLFQLNEVPASAPVPGPLVSSSSSSPVLAFDQATQRLYVLGENNMDVFSAKGEYVSQFATATTGDSIAFDKLTSDTFLGSTDVEVISDTGSLLSSPWNGADTPPGSFFGNEAQLALDQTTEHLYAAVSGVNDTPPHGLGVVYEYEASPSEKYLGQITGTPSGTFPESKELGEVATTLPAVAVDPATGHVYIAQERYGVENASVVDIFGPDIVYAAEVSRELPANVTAHKAELTAQLNGGEGVQTSYHFEYGTTNDYGTTTPEASGEHEFTATAQIENLEPGTEYHFRIAATNINGTSYGPDQTFVGQSNSIGLPDGRGYELVSPVANANGNVYTVGSSTFCGECSEAAVRASADGNAVEYVADPLATGGDGQQGSGRGNQFVAMRGSGSGWSPVDLSTPGFDGEPFEALFTNELSNSGTSIVPAGTHRLVENGEGLFDSVGGRLLAVSVLPEGEGSVVSDASFGSREIADGNKSDLSHAVSADGSRIFWTDLEEGPYKERIFVRENDGGTVPVSAGAAKFWTASPDGQYAFYTEGERLLRFDVEDGSREELAGNGAGVLGVIGVNETGEDGAYVYFVADGVLGDGAEHGAIPGNCINTSSPQEDEINCNLYVSHNGVTTFIAGLANIDNKYTGTGAAQAKGDWLPELDARTAEVTPDGHTVVFESYARLTSYDNDGQHEVYVYNADTGRLSCASCNPTEEPAVTGAVRTKTGAPAITGANLPISLSDIFMHRWISDDGTRVFFESPEALVAQDTNEQMDVYEWEQEGAGSCQVNHPARRDGGCIYLLSGGTSPEASYLLDASANGDDVFMISRAQLAPEDQGETYEVYDARVGVEPPVGEPACTGTGCQGLPAAPPIFATPSSVTFNGVGNFPPSTAPSGKPKPKTKPVKCAKRSHKSNGKCVRNKTKKPKARKPIHGKGSK